MHLLALSLVLLAAPDGGEPVADAGSAADAAATRHLLTEERAKLNQLLDRQASVLDALDSASRAVAQSEVEAKAAEADERTARTQLVQARADAEGASAALSARLHSIEPRLLTRYRLRHGGAAEMLLSSDSLSDLLWRQRTLDAVLSTDLQLLRDARDDAERLRRAQAAQQVREVEYAQKEKDLQARLLETRRRRDQLSALLAAVEAQKDAREKTLEELARAATRLETLAAPAAVAYIGKTNFEAQRGRLGPPVEGVLEVKFGRVVNKRFRTTVMQKGIDLRADEGSPVHSVAAGKVVHAAWLRGYGNLLIIDHGQGYFTLYAHLAGFDHQVGDEVKPGERVGSVGDTGSLKGSYLYFEIRHHGTPLNPAPWLMHLVEAPTPTP